MKKLFRVDVDYIITHPETICADNADEAEQTVRENVETPDFILRMMRGDFSGDPVDPHVFSVVEIKPTDAEIQEVRDWAADMVGSMAYEDTEFVCRTATKEDIRKSLIEWELEGQEIPKFADAGDLWQAILDARKARENPTPGQEDQIEAVQAAVSELLRVMLKDDHPNAREDRHQVALELADEIAEMLAEKGCMVYYPTHVEGEGWRDTYR